MRFGAPLVSVATERGVGLALGGRDHGGEEQRAVEECDVLAVGEGFAVEREVEFDLDLVAVLPGAVDGDVAAFVGVGLDGGSVDLHGHLLRPDGLAEVERELLGFLEAELDLGGLRERERGLEFKIEAELVVLQFGGPVLVHGHGGRAVGGEADLGVAFRVLHAGPDAAPPGVELGGEDFVVRGAEGEEVAVFAGLLADVGGDVVQRHLLGEVHRLRVLVPLEDVHGDLDHVEGVAGLGGVRLQRAVHVVHVVEMLAFAVAAVRVGALRGDFREEVFGAGARLFVALDLIQAGEAGDLRDLRVRVDAVEDVALFLHRAEDAVVEEEAASGLGILLVAGVRGEVDHDLEHAAVLGAEHVLHLVGAEVAQGGDHAVRELLLHVESLLVSGQTVRVAESGEDFVDGVERHPDAVQVERLRTHRAAFEVVQPAFVLGVDVPGAELVLALREFVDNVVAAFLRLLVAAVRVRHGERGEVVAQRMARDVARFPAAVGLRLRFESRHREEFRQQGVRVQRFGQKDFVDFLAVRHRAVLEVRRGGRIERQFSGGGGELVVGRGAAHGGCGGCRADRGGGKDCCMFHVWFS